ncbi:dynamin family protein [Vreelandella sulfidaeris]|uniref:dynamin family protein n=1 Tax=Vreelandella sulfidaeris TaxID=115553 RepID=UPI0035E6C050
MNNIEIIHNPFTVDTQFRINGQSPAASCKLSSYSQSRLQQWVEGLFNELSELFNGDDNFHIVFQGVESDFLDVQEAANEAIANGIQVELVWIESEPTDQRLKKISNLIDEAHEHPKFKRFVEENDEARQSLAEAFNRDFDVYVVGTMSSGKSTLINAMLGRDLLPSANEASTATIARITDNDQMPDHFKAKRYNRSSQLVGEEDNADQGLLKDWNGMDDTQLIDIEGNIVAIQERPDVRLVLTDTPGPNNSQDEEHQLTTMGFVQDSNRNPLILYVLNASQLGTNDDRNLLGLVAESMRKVGKQSKDRFIFVVNKMDVFDPESGEHPSQVLARVKQYLIDNDILNPLIYPASANLTRLIRKPQDQHTRKERGDFRSMADLFSEEPSMNLLQYMPITEKVKHSLQQKNLSSLMLSSGLPAVETMIDEYIDKYNVPHRLKRAYDALTQAIDVGLNEAEMIQQLDQSERQLEQLNEEIQTLQQRQEKGFDTVAYKDELEREGRALPQQTVEKLVELQGSFIPLLQELKKEFSNNKAQPHIAKEKLQEAEKTLKFEHKKLINEYEILFITNQEAIRNDLYKEYQRYIADLFEDVENLNLPILEGIKQATSNISFNLSLEQKEVKKDRREISISKWYNPFSWGKTESYDSGDFVDLNKAWAERATRVNGAFNNLIENASEHIEESNNLLIDQFSAFMTREFSHKFDELLKDLRNKTSDHEARERAIIAAKEQHAWLIDFRNRLDKTLAISTEGGK